MLVITPATDIDDFRELTLFPRWSCSILITAWEQRKLGDCFDFLQNNTLSRADLNPESGSARNIHYGDILIKFGDCLGLGSDKLPFVDDESILSKYVNSTLRVGDIIFADTAEDESAGKCVELVELPNEPVISGLHTIPVRPIFPFGSGYLGHYLNAPAYHNQLLPLMQGIKVISVSKTALQDTQICFPSVSEQFAIGASLNALDFLITLHQRKRCNGPFTHPLVWEQRKLGDVATIVGGGTPSTNNDAYWDGDIDWYSPAELGEQVYADRSVRRITQAGYDSCSATLLPAGKTILFTSRAGIGNAAILRGSACTNQGFQSLVVNDDTDVYFVYSMTDRIKKFAEQNASGSTFLEISGKGLAAGEFAFPSKDEQTAIGSMFKQLDHLITLHQ